MNQIDGIEMPEVRVVGEERAAGRGHGPAPTTQSFEPDAVVPSHAVADGPARRCAGVASPRPAIERQAAASLGVDGRRLATGRRLARRPAAVAPASAVVASRPGTITGAPSRIGREQLVGPRRVAEPRVGEEPEQLLVHVAAEVPRLDLLPGDRVERRPRLRLSSPVSEEREHRALPRCLVEPGVDALGVRVQDGPGVRRHRAPGRARPPAASRASG